MTYKTHNTDVVNINGTSLQDYIDTTYDVLVDIFGEPDPQQLNDGYKVDWEWTIKFECGTVARIYNWKNGPNYCGEAGVGCHQVKQWHIGGFKHEAVRLVEQAIEQHQINSTTLAMDKLSEAMNPVNAAPERT
tara:strand:- start:1482 stop:1880 length:399 start_codon:yes stop_codon:yes gene_type:complete